MAWHASRRLLSGRLLGTAGVVLTNAVPVVGVVALGWQVSTVFVLYWIESGLLLLRACGLGLLARQEPEGAEGPAPDWADRRIRPVPGGPPIALRNVPLVVVTAITFGLMWAGVGWVVLAFFVRILETVEGPLSLAAVGLGAVGVALGQLHAFGREVLVDGVHRSISPTRTVRIAALRWRTTAAALLALGFVFPAVVPARMHLAPALVAVVATAKLAFDLRFDDIRDG